MPFHAPAGIEPYPVSASAHAFEVNRVPCWPDTAVKDLTAGHININRFIGGNPAEPGIVVQ